MRFLLAVDKWAGNHRGRQYLVFAIVPTVVLTAFAAVLAPSEPTRVLGVFLALLLVFSMVYRVHRIAAREAK